MGIQIKGLSPHRFFYLGLIFLPATLTQTVSPVVSHQAWDDFSESIYPFFLSAVTPDTQSSSNVAIVKIGPETEKELGENAVANGVPALLKHLHEADRPYILSMVQFKNLGTRSKTAELSKAITSYGNLIGSPFELSESDVQNSPDVIQQIESASFTRDASIANGIGNQPIRALEPVEVMKGQRARGFLPVFDGKSPVNCFQPYVGDSDGELAIPTSLLWAAAYGGHASMTLGNGSQWPRKGETIEFSFREKLDVGDRQCFRDPNTLTNDAIALRSIQEFELSSVLRSDPTTLRNKVIVLADARRSQTMPSSSAVVRDGAAPEDYEIAARFLDSLMTGNTVKRQRLEDFRQYDWLPIMIALIVATISFFFGSSTVVGLSSLTWLILVAYSAFRLLVHSEFAIPIQAVTSTFASSLSLALAHAALHLAGMSRVKKFSHKLAQAFAGCPDLETLNAAAITVARQEFQVFELALSGYNKALYATAGSVERGRRFLNENGAASLDRPNNPFADSPGKLSTVLTTVKAPPAAGKLSLGSRGITAKIAINGADRRVGTAEVLLSYKSHEELFVADMVNTFQQHLATHWDRIDKKIRADLTKLVAPTGTNNGAAS